MNKPNTKKHRQPCQLTEERVREIAREEIRHYMGEEARFMLALSEQDHKLFGKLAKE